MIREAWWGFSFKRLRTSDLDQKTTVLNPTKCFKKQTQEKCGQYFT